LNTVECAGFGCVKLGLHHIRKSVLSVSQPKFCLNVWTFKGYLVLYLRYKEHLRHIGKRIYAAKQIRYAIVFEHNI